MSLNRFIDKIITILKQSFSISKLFPLLISLIVSYTPIFLDNIYFSTAVNAQAATNTAIGFNVTGITNYGYPDILPYSSSSQISETLQEMQSMGAKVIRVFAANDQVSDDESSKRLDLFLTQAQQYNISVVVCFIDFYHSRFNPSSTDQYYTDNFNGITLLNDAFFGGGYQTSYKPFVVNMVTNNKNHPNIYAWEIGNEIKDTTSTSNLINFMNDTISTIKGIDSTHAVSTGMLNAAHTGLFPQQLYPNLKNLDFITVHTYNGDHNGLADVSWANQNGKNAIIEELGFDPNLGPNGDRSQLIQNEVNFWTGNGVSALLQWGFLSKQITSDNGNGDKTFGMDVIWHKDYNSLFSTYQRYINPSPSPTNSPTPTVTPSPTNTPAPSPTPVSISFIGYTISDKLYIRNSSTKPDKPTSSTTATFPFVFSDTTPGVKTAFVRFFYSDGSHIDRQSSIEYNP